MNAKALRITALLLLALLTTAAPCDPPTAAGTVYVVHGGYESGHVTLASDVWTFSDQINGSLELQFTRDGVGNVVDGPVTLNDFRLHMSVDRLGLISVVLPTFCLIAAPVVNR
jgi:hypothetical protein